MKTITYSGVSVDYSYGIHNGSRYGFAIETYSTTAATYTDMTSYIKLIEDGLELMKADGAKWFMFRGQNASIAYAVLKQSAYPEEVYYQGKLVPANRVNTIIRLAELHGDGNVLSCAQAPGGKLPDEVVILIELVPGHTRPITFMEWNAKGEATYIGTDIPKSNRYKVVWDFAPGDHLLYDITINANGGTTSKRKGL